MWTAAEAGALLGAPCLELESRLYDSRSSHPEDRLKPRLQRGQPVDEDYEDLPSPIPCTPSRAPCLELESRV